MPQRYGSMVRGVLQQRLLEKKECKVHVQKRMYDGAQQLNAKGENFFLLFWRSNTGVQRNATYRPRLRCQLAYQSGRKFRKQFQCLMNFNQVSRLTGTPLKQFWHAIVAIYTHFFQLHSFFSTHTFSSPTSTLHPTVCSC